MEHVQEFCLEEHVQRAEVQLSCGHPAATHRYVAAELGHTPLSHQHAEGNVGEAWQELVF